MMSNSDSKLPAEDKEKSNRKQIQCPFRLMNVIFSDDFIEDFTKLGDASSRQQLDAGKAGKQQHFWERLSVAFAEPMDAYGRLYFLDDDVMAENDHINPSKIVRHDWKKLRSMWKSINADYKAALTRFTQSGTHDHNFYAFCNGKLETYYLRKYLDMRPHVNATVEALLPEECALSSDGTVSVLTNSSGKKAKRGNNDIAEAIREYNKDSSSAEVARQKLVYMEKEDTRREQAEIRQQDDH